MDFSTLTFDQVALAVLTVLAIREAMIAFLPDSVAGPGGWLVDTRAGDHV
ncbi:hypothetical protein [Celeribacter sp.]